MIDVLNMRVPSEIFYTGFVDELGKIAQVASVGPTGTAPIGAPGPPLGMAAGRRQPRPMLGTLPGTAQTRNPQAALAMGMAGGMR